MTAALARVCIRSPTTAGISFDDKFSLPPLPVAAPFVFDRLSSCAAAAGARGTSQCCCRKGRSAVGIAAGLPVTEVGAVDPVPICVGATGDTTTAVWSTAALA